ncbi:MAG: DUF6496 domain-containing protein [Burkholderiales bacterium]
MPDKKTLERAAQDKREGKAPTTQAGEFVREEIEHIREGKHGARSPEQAIAIGLSKARRAGVDLPPPKTGTTSKKTRRSAEPAYTAGKKSTKKTSKKRARAVERALKREPRSTVSKKALSKHARTAAKRRSASSRSASARKATKTKGSEARSAAARKAARTRARNK